jgi:hypothetical protein
VFEDNCFVKNASTFGFLFFEKIIEQPDHIFPMVEKWGTEVFAEGGQFGRGERLEEFVEAGVLHS